jgi:hypothetical protein
MGFAALYPSYEAMKEIQLSVPACTHHPG